MTSPSAPGPPYAGHTSRSGDLREALSDVMGGREHPPVRASIEASWRRSVDDGLDPSRFSVRNVDVDPDSLLNRAAHPVGAELAADVADARLAVILTDPEGSVIDRWAEDAALRRTLDRIFLAPGFVYAEPVAGTNAIGTALADRAPSVVEADEHFADALTGMACAAVPIRDLRTGRTIGALDLTCLADDAMPLMLPLVRRAARDIEERILESAGVADQALLRRFLKERGRTKSPFVLVNDRTVMTSAAADHLLTAEDETLLRGIAKTISGGKTSTEVVLASGLRAVVSAEPAADPDEPSGVLLTLAIDDPRHPADGTPERKPFGWDTLTDTEQSVVDLVAQGLTNRQVAERLFMSRHTVDFHLRSIFRKLDVSSRVELTRLALERRAS